MHQGFHPDIQFREIDLFNIQETTELIKELNPEAIFNSACVQSWWEIYTLPKKMFQRLEPTLIGSWLMMHLSTSYSLMRAVKTAGYHRRIPVIISTLPDIVAPVLARIGLEPTCGGGNLQLMIPYLKRKAARKLKAPTTAIEIWLVGGHGLIQTPGEQTPFWIKVESNGEDVTEELGGKEWALRCIQPLWERETITGPPPQQATAAAFLSNFIGILFDKKRLVGTIPGIKGFVGGYPARLGNPIELALPKEISLKEAREINHEAMQIGDAVEEIKNDGSIVVTEKAHQIMKQAFGWDHREWAIDENVELALELNKKFKKLRARTQ
jgi:hypothetical protein